MEEETKRLMDQKAKMRIDPISRYPKPKIRKRTDMEHNIGQEMIENLNEPHENRNETHHEKPLVQKNHENPDALGVTETQESQEKNEQDDEMKMVPVLRKDFGSSVKEQIQTTFERIEIDINELKPHPQNEMIYGQEDVSDLVALIQETGKIEPLIINKDNTIISGHRRWLAAKELNIQTLYCEIREFDTHDEELLELIIQNQNRNKTTEQRIREGLGLEKVFASDAYNRKLGNLKQNQPDLSDVDRMATSDMAGKTRDRVAQKVGIPSGKTYARGKNVILKIDELKNVAKDDYAKMLVAVLNKSASAAEDLATKVELEALSEDDIRDLTTGKKSPRLFVKKENTQKANNEDKVKTPTELSAAREQIQAINEAIKILKRMSLIKENKNPKIQEGIKKLINGLQNLLPASD